MTDGGSPVQGWYADPQDPGQLRWWDGGQWTDYTQFAPIDVEPAGAAGADGSGTSPTSAGGADVGAAGAWDRRAGSTGNPALTTLASRGSSPITERSSPTASRVTVSQRTTASSRTMASRLRSTDRPLVMASSRGTASRHLSTVSSRVRPASGCRVRAAASEYAQQPSEYGDQRYGGRRARQRTGHLPATAGGRAVGDAARHPAIRLGLRMPVRRRVPAAPEGAFGGQGPAGFPGPSGQGFPPQGKAQVRCPAPLAATRHLPEVRHRTGYAAPGYGEGQAPHGFGQQAGFGTPPAGYEMGAQQGAIHPPVPATHQVRGQPAEAGGQPGHGAPPDSRQVPPEWGRQRGRRRFRSAAARFRAAACRGLWAGAGWVREQAGYGQQPGYGQPPGMTKRDTALKPAIANSPAMGRHRSSPGTASRPGTVSHHSRDMASRRVTGRRRPAIRSSRGTVNSLVTALHSPATARPPTASRIRRSGGYPGRSSRSRGLRGRGWRSSSAGPCWLVWCC